MSTRRQPGVYQVSTRCQPGVNQASTRCQPGVNQVSTRCQPGVYHIVDGVGGAVAFNVLNDYRTFNTIGVLQVDLFTLSLNKVFMDLMDPFSSMVDVNYFDSAMSLKLITVATLTGAAGCGGVVSPPPPLGIASFAGGQFGKSDTQS